MVGFWVGSEKEFGPVQAYVAPLKVWQVNGIGWPAQIDPGPETTGVAGTGFTVTLVVPGAEEQPPTVRTTEYIPLFSITDEPIVGF